MKDLTSKTCLLTGTASGIGRSLAFGLARQGTRLLPADIDVKNLEKVNIWLGYPTWVLESQVLSLMQAVHDSGNVGITSTAWPYHEKSMNKPTRRRASMKNNRTPGNEKEAKYEEQSYS